MRVWPRRRYGINGRERLDMLVLQILDAISDELEPLPLGNEFVLEILRTEIQRRNNIFARVNFAMFLCKSSLDLLLGLRCFLGRASR